MHPQFERNAKRFDSLAQQVEHNTFNVGVLGSSPKRITKKERAPLFPFLFLSFSNFSLIFLYVLKKWFIFAPNIRHNLIVETMVILVIKKDEKG